MWGRGVGMTADSGDGRARLYARSWRISQHGYPETSALRDLVAVLVPALEALEGFRGGTMLIDRDTGDLIGTTYWDTLEHLEAGQTRSRNAAAGAAALTEATSMEVSICDVVLSHPVPRHLAPELKADEA